MGFEELFRDYWWLIFPVFGMGMAVFGMMQDERRTNRTMDLIKSYVDQGKEPPPELLRLAGAAEAEGKQRDRSSRTWTFFVFAALAVGFGAGWYLLGAESDAAFAFATVAVTMAVLAVGALVVLIFGAKS